MRLPGKRVGGVTRAGGQGTCYPTEVESGPADRAAPGGGYASTGVIWVKMYFPFDQFVTGLA